MESPVTSPRSPSSAAEQARIRRERRQAKIIAQGESRINKITSTHSNPSLYESFAAAEKENKPKEIKTSTRIPSPILPDPAEPHLDIPVVRDDTPDESLSEHYYQPPSKTRQEVPQPRRVSQAPPHASQLNDFSDGPLEEEMKLFMAQYGVPGLQQPEVPGVDDPMVTLLQQMMGMPQKEGSTGEESAAQPLELSQDKWGNLWKLLHTIGALALVLWSLNVSGLGAIFDGSLEQRKTGDVIFNFFHYFASMELVLQSFRFIIEKGRPPPGSMLSMIGQVLPPKIGNYFITVARYSVIWTTVMSDAFIIIFVLGMVAWWNSRG